MTESSEEKAIRTIGRRVWRGLQARPERLRLPAITLIDLQYKEKARNFSFPRHVHEHHFECYYVDRGRVRYSIEDRPLRRLDRQQMLLVPPKVAHEVVGDPASATSVITLHFDGPEILKRIPELRQAAGRAIPHDAELGAAMNKLCALARSAQPLPSWRHSAALFRLVLRLSELGEQASREGKPIGPPSLRFLDRLESYVKGHLQERLTLADLAGAMGCSVSKLTHEFQRRSGQTPHALILRCRMDRAKELLRHSDISVKEVASLTGFSSQTNFGRSFLKAEKMTPGDYRRTLSAAR